MSSSTGHKDEFLLSTKAARDQRLLQRQKDAAAVVVQKHVRGFVVRRRAKRQALEDFDRVFPEGAAEDAAKPAAAQCYRALRRFLALCPVSEQPRRLERACQRLLSSLASPSAKTSYISVALNPSTALPWIAHLKTLLSACVERLDRVELNTSAGQRELTTWLRTLVSFTATHTWALLNAAPALEKLRPGMNRLCANLMGHLVREAGLFPALQRLLRRGLAAPPRPLLTPTGLAAVITLAWRPVASADVSDNLLSPFLLHVLSAPALLSHLAAHAPDSLAWLRQQRLLPHALSLLAHEQQLKIHFNALEGSYALCLTANLVHLVSLETPDEFRKLSSPDLVFVLTRLFDCCGGYVSSKQSNLSHWHPVLGWFSVQLDEYLQASFGKVKSQLALLWSPACLRLLISPLADLARALPELPVPPAADLNALNLQEGPSSSSSSSAKQLLKKAFEKTKAGATSAVSQAASYTSSGSSSSQLTKLGSPECTRAALVCGLYQSALKTLSNIRMEILAGLCYQNLLLAPLWRLIQSLGPQCGLKTFLDHLSAHPKGTAPEFQLLILFCDCLSYVVTILDDVEFYERSEPFSLGQYAQMGQFLNNFLYKSAALGLLTDPQAPLFASLHALLMALYARDNRRPYVGPGHWLVKELRVSVFTADLDKGKKSALLLLQKMPHVMAHEDRVVLFRRKVTADKSKLGISLPSDRDASHAHSTLITVHRSRLVEDGDRQLSTLSSRALKGVVRVKFVNAQGLDEAGIDQDGVFKEFLEETIKKVFDPCLNLFCTTSEERLYPSPLSHLTDNHLHLFEFVGKMIGKAVYEGIVVDVPFAPFFLSQVLGKDHTTALYSYVDELPSLDAELYRNLTYMKHYDGDVSDLDLTFSLDQDMMGQIVSHELVPGGRAVAVTNENRIAYMHHVAQFRMHTQIKEQIAAFTRGFRQLVPNDWLQLFSPPEVQRLISGDNTPLDLRDLRKHTHYYGGFHDSHRVVSWLWDVLEKDFHAKERAAFLKFVTSCSKPPLLGFEHLEPPFSIRCVEVGDDDDDGDTVGSVLRGFLALRKKDPVNRLPTASTCFNLLKLPNYQKRSTLRDKLRYAISCNTGFELS